MADDNSSALLNSSASQPDEARHFGAKDGSWLNIMKVIQSLDETLSNLESNFKAQAVNMPGMIKELLNKDKKNFEQSWDSLKSNWTSKCREIANLKKSMNRMVDEKKRLREENQSLEKSISRLQEQFSQSVNSSLVEIQSLTSANSRLTDELQRFEEVNRNSNVKVKKAIREKLDNFGQNLVEVITDKNIVKELVDRLKGENLKIEKLLTENMTDENRMKTNIESALNLGKSIENKRLETMEIHLRELEKELTEKNVRIRELEGVNDKECGGVVSDVTVEERNWFDQMRKSMSADRISQSDCIEAFEVSLITKGLKSAQHFVQDVKEHLAEVYNGTICNEDELHDMRSNIDDVTIRLKATQSKLESAEGENEYLKRKLEQEEGKLKVSRDEIISLQSRIHMLNQEKEAAELRINDIKGGKEDFKEFCSNLSAENDKLFTEISRLQADRDSVLEQLQETSRKYAHVSEESQNFEGKREILEKSLAKLKRDFQEQGRELQNYAKENEEMRLLLHEKEASFTESKNEFRNIDIVNKDLEDQVFQITNENQKMQIEISKLKSGKKQLEIEVKEKKLLIEKLENSEKNLEERIRQITKSEKSGLKNNSDLKNELELNEEILEKSLDRISGLAEIIRQILKQTRAVLMEFGSDSDNKEILSNFESLIKLDITDENENIIEHNNLILDLLIKTQNVFLQKYKATTRFLQDVYTIINKAEIRFQFDDDLDKDNTCNLQEKQTQTKSRLSWILKDYKRLCDGPIRVEDSEKIQNLKDIVLRYIVAATKQLEVIFNNVSGKDCVMMLLPTAKETEGSIEDSNDDLIHYLRDTFRANQVALETAVGTLELVKLKGECDVITEDELTAKIIDTDQNEICHVIKRMNKLVDSLTEKIQSLMSSAEIVRSSSTSSFDTLESNNESDSGTSLTVQLKAFKSMAENRGKEIDKLKSEVDFMKMERVQLMSEIQEKDFDLGKLEDEMRRLVNSSSGLETQFSQMKLEYETTSKELVERENELKMLKEGMKQRDREGDAGELSSTESARSEIERKEHELRRLRSSLEDIRNVHCLNEGRIKNLQNKIEGVTQILSSREKIDEEPVEEKTESSSRKEQLLIVREIELKTSKAEFCDAEDLKKRVKADQSSTPVDSEISRQLQSKEKENVYLQSVVKELKMELMDVQRGLSQEIASRSQLNNMMNSKQRMPARSKPDAAYENEQLRRRNREYDIIRRNYLEDSFDVQTRSSDDNSLSSSYYSPKHFGYPTTGHDAYAHDSYANDCEICAMESVSGASTYICSDEECECEYASCEMSDTSFASDDDYDRSRMVSPGYRGVFSREAKNVSLQEATFAIKAQHQKIRRRTISPPPAHNPPASPGRHKKRHTSENEPGGTKYFSPQITRSNSARSAARPRSATLNYDGFERRYSLDRKASLERRPLSESGKFYKTDSLSGDGSTRSQPSSDECSSISSGSGQCSRADYQHDCKKRKGTKMRGKLV